MPGYIIHIGPHKTGTTWLQHAFTRLRPLLAVRGILYPEQWGGAFGHHDLAERVSAGDPGLRAEFDTLNRSTTRIILLSTETFSYADAAGVRRLQALLNGAPARIVFYCRRWSELVPSAWGQGIRHGSLLTFPSFAYSQISDPWACELLNFGTVLDRYAHAFGEESLRIVSYNRVMESREDLLTHFCRHFLDWPDPPPGDPGRVNESLDMIDHEIIRALNVLEWNKERDRRRILTMEYLAAKPDLPVPWLINHAMQFNVESLRIDDGATALAMLHASLAARFRPLQIDPVPPMGLFQPRIADINYVQPNYLMADGVMDTLRAMHATVTARRSP